MATKSIVMSSDCETREDRKVQEMIRAGLEVVINHLYETGYLDPVNEIVEANITIRTRLQNVPGDLS